MITILGPTASGKTKIAVQVACRIGGEIISADSRQVYRGMDIGTGKDLDEYHAGGHHIPVHLIDIREPGHEYNIFEFRNDFLEAWQGILSRGKAPIMCGGSGMYLDSILSDYHLTDASETDSPKDKLQKMSHEELTGLLRSMKKLHNKTDLEDRERLIKAIRIAERSQTDSSGYLPKTIPDLRENIFGISIPRPVQMQRISERLTQRLRTGMIEETERLLASGITPERLIRYGLEYRFTTLYLTGKITFQEMEEKLNIAIRQFAKRQMTWFRGMERRGIRICWIDGQRPVEETASEIISRVTGGEKSNRNQE